MSSKIRIKAVPCEVWSRIVGYYRPVKNWNDGKKEEFRDRRSIRANSMAPKQEKFTNGNS